MARKSYVALLRGINVGGRNAVAMADLRAAFDHAGYRDVRTYINSGNVLFGTDRPSKGLEDEIEHFLERRFDVPLVVVVRSHAQFGAVVHDAPDEFGAHTSRYHSDVLFLKRTVNARRLLADIPLREGVDRSWAGAGVIYFERLSARRTQSKLSRFASMPAYKQTTIRSWSTTTKLLAMLDE